MSRPNQVNDILLVNNPQILPIPQFLGNDFESFKEFEELCQKYNYKEVNLNFGCPSKTVTNRNYGSGILNKPEIIDEFLKNIFENTNLKISIKCRLGYESPDEFEKLIPIFNKYPLQELIIHPRVGTQQYKGNILYSDFVKYSKEITAPICFNGDITTKKQVENLVKEIPNLKSIMIGRGILQNLFLLNEIFDIQLSKEEKQQKLLTYNQFLLKNCNKKYSGEKAILNRLTEMWQYHALAFENSNKIFKKIRKCKSIKEYSEITSEIISLIL